MRKRYTYKIAYNANWGGFGLSDSVKNHIENNGFEPPMADAEHYCPEWFFSLPENRANPYLIKALEAFPNDRRDVEIREIPSDSHVLRYRIHEYDGSESVILLQDEEYHTINPQQ